MFSYLSYIFACTRKWIGLHHEPWVNGMKVYGYYPHLQQKEYVENFMRYNDVFVGKLVFELRGNMNKRMSAEVRELVSIYGSYYIQFSIFTYIRVGGFEGELFKLPRYALNNHVLIEVCRQLAHIDKKLKEKGKSGVIFLVDLGHYSCKFVSNALNLELEFKKLNLQPYVSKHMFENRGYAIEHLNVDANF